MADFFLNTASSLDRTLLNNESGFITQNGALVTNGEDAVVGSGNNQLTVLGTLAVQGINNFNAYDFDGNSATVFIGSAGHVSADDDALDIFAVSSIIVDNAGTIFSLEDALDLRTSDGSALIEVHNSGVIQADSDGIIVRSGTSTATIINTGQILSNDSGIWNSFNDVTGDFLLINSGEIIGEEYGYNGNETSNQTIHNSGLISGIEEFAIEFNGGDNLSVTNSGTIDGDILMGGSGSVGNVFNSGLISGDIFFSDGDDVYNGSGSGAVGGTVMGGSGNDTLRSSDAADSLDGGIASDLIVGRGGDDTLRGDTGADTIRGGDGDDDIDGEVNADLINGNAGDDTVLGGGGDDTLRGGRDDDELRGGNGADNIRGDSGDDLIIGGAARDDMFGGAGNDVFVFESTSDSGTGAVRDRIFDFRSGEDTLDISALAGPQFNFIGSGNFTGSGPQVRAVAAANGTLIYIDADGDGVRDSDIYLIGTASVVEGDFLL